MNDLLDNITKPEKIEELYHRILQIIAPIYEQVTPDEIKFRKNYRQAKMSDVQIIALQLLIESQGKTQNSGFHFFKKNYPNLVKYPDRTRFHRTLKNLQSVIQEIRFTLRVKNNYYDYAIIDSFPIVSNKFGRAYFGKRLRDICSYGYCASKKEKYYGLKVHAITSLNGNPIDFIVTSANVDDRDAVFELANCNILNLFGDKGYVKKGFYEEVKDETGTRLWALQKKNSKDPLPKDFRNKISYLRRRIETTFGQLVELFDIERIRANTKLGLLTFLECKFLCYNILALIGGNTKISTVANFN